MSRLPFVPRVNRRTGPLVLALALALPPAGPPQDVQTPGPLAGIAGLAGFTSVSRVVFPDEGSPPHRFETVYLFPDRARWRLLAIDGRASERMLVYRHGGRAYQLAPGQTRSTEFEADSLATTLVQVELRRAAMLWPHGFAWTGSGNERTAPLASCAGSEDGIGVLAATLGEDGRPDRIRALDARGDEVEAVGIAAWQDSHGRSWPRTLTLSRGESTIWQETVESVQTKVYFVDLFFQPPDRRPAPQAPVAGGRSVLSLDLQGITFRGQELEPDTGWEQALAAARDAIEQARTGKRLRVDPVPAFELDAAGRPRRILLRLAERDDTPDEGWTTLPDRPGLALVLDDPGPLEAQVDAGLLAALAAAAPPGSRPGVPYCRVLERAEGRQVQLYLPLEGP